MKGTIHQLILEAQARKKKTLSTTFLLPPVGMEGAGGESRELVELDPVMEMAMGEEEFLT